MSFSSLQHWGARNASKDGWRKLMFGKGSESPSGEKYFQIKVAPSVSRPVSVSRIAAGWRTTLTGLTLLISILEQIQVRQSFLVGHQLLTSHLNLWITGCGFQSRVIFLHFIGIKTFSYTALACPAFANYLLNYSNSYTKHCFYLLVADDMSKLSFCAWLSE